MAALSRMAAHLHKKISILPGDTVIFSSHPIPGNEKAVSNVINELSAQGANVVFQDVHVSGHACQEEIKLVYSLVRPKFAIPKGIVLLLGAVCFIMFMVEGSILDWGALFLMEDKGAAIEHAGMGFAVFSVAMTLMRLLGDRVIMAIGPRKTVVFGAAGAAAAFALAVLSPGFWGSLAAFFLIGLGVANLVPIAFAATGEQKEMPMSLALSAATTMGYAGLLAGPAGIGALAKATSLSFAFLCEAALLVAVAAVALFTRVFRSKA